MAHLPVECLHNLGGVHLTDTAALRQSNRWHSHRAVYYPRTTDRRAFIEIVVDRLFLASPDLFQWLVGLVVGRGAWFAQVLYHEVGHHLAHVSGQRIFGADAELAADTYSWRFYWRFIRDRSGWALPLLLPILAAQWLCWSVRASSR
jgi:hypothetical protein